MISIQRVSMRQARIAWCCQNLVTTAAQCPLCSHATHEHKEANDPHGYCCECAKQWVAEELHLVTWEEDPYLQTEDGDLITLCPRCHAKKLREEGAL